MNHYQVKSILLPALFFLLASAHQLTAQHLITGKITSQSGIPLQSVTVQLIHQHTAGLTNDKGIFCLRNIKTGRDTLIIKALGYQPKQHIVHINKDHDSLLVNLMLIDTSVQLKEITVNADMMSDQKSMYVAKMPLKNLDNPQVYNVVSEKLMQEQLITRIDDVFKNVPGTIAQSTSGGYFSITSRGFNTYVSARNGTSVSSYFTSYDPANIERIEVLKGPSGTLYQGAASFGGAVNLVTKRPHKTRSGRISYATGSWGLNRATLDLNLPLDSADKFLFRINTSGDREKTFQDFGHSNIYTLSPSFIYQASDKWNIFAEFEVYTSEKTPTPWQSFDGHYSNVKDIPVYKQAYASDDLKSHLIRQNGTVTSAYQISDNWQSSTVLSSLNTSVDHNYFAYNYFLSRDTFRRYTYDYDYNYSSINIQQNFVGRFKLFHLKNKIVAGVEYLNTTFNYTGYGTNYDTASIHNFEPMLRKNVEKAIEQRHDYMGADTWSQSRYAAYASDLIHLTPSLMTMLSLRIDKFSYQSSAPYSQTAFSPKLGIVYQPIIDVLAIFANYNDGFSNQSTATKSDGTIINLDPLHATQYEGGIKWDAPNQKFAGTLSIYNIRIHNANLYDKDGFFVSQKGIQRSKGLELEFKAMPAENLSIIAGYGYNENKYLKSSSYEGSLAPNAPQNIINGWINYSFPKSKLHSFSVGVGANYVDVSYTDVYNETIMPSYCLLSAVLGYHLDKTDLGLKLNNLTDQKYFTGSGNPMAPRSFVASVSFSF